MHARWRGRRGRRRICSLRYLFLCFPVMFLSPCLSLARFLRWCDGVPFGRRLRRLISIYLLRANLSVTQNFVLFTLSLEPFLSSSLCLFSFSLGLFACRWCDGVSFGCRLRRHWLQFTFYVPTALSIKITLSSISFLGPLLCLSSSPGWSSSPAFHCPARIYTSLHEVVMQIEIEETTE